jgi:hypothetical protein
MKALWLIALIAVSQTAFAETELTCWNMYSKKGSAPILKATITQQVNLENVNLDLKDPLFELYFENKTESAGTNWGNKPQTTLSTLSNPKGVLQASLITTNRSPYKGNNEYSITLGHYSFKAPYITQEWDYTARLILPADLTSKNLADFRIRNKEERSNAVMVYSPASQMHQGGDNYLRMFCTSK